MSFRTWLRTWALVGCIAATQAPRASLAQTSPANIAAARSHFEKARTCYEQGAYREAISELEAAHTLDPTAKDLVFNLGVVHEKLADIDEALKWFRQYTTMDLTATERSRADAYIHRLEGAKRELEEKQAAAQTPPPESAPPALEPPPPSSEAPPAPSANPGAPPPPPQLLPPASAPPPIANGRFDAATATALSLSAASLAFGIVMGVKAEKDKPTSSYVTGRDGTTYQDLQNLVDQAHREAIMADIGFATSLVSAVAAAYLYLGRSRPVSSPPAGSATVSAGPLAGGGTLFVKGSF
ncbi:MAG TPA: tetratricopeptide repeat protein [Polyangiaceae bacterium]